jgi:hypothetical protein
MAKPWSTKMENLDWKQIFRVPEVAFKQAIARGSLTDRPGYFKYAGNWMYMHTDVSANGTFDYFKHIDTREYIHVKVDGDV